jgi:REP element-mobilizing transposase RayT
LRKRKTPLHFPPQEKGIKPVIIYVTVCTDKRKRILCEDGIHNILLKAWNDANAWQIGRYLIMPDHIHLFCSPGKDEFVPISQWIRFWKSVVSRSWPRPKYQPVWQKSFWDTQLRSEERYDEKWEYVRNNPVRAGLCAQSDDWPWQGELNILEW